MAQVGQLVSELKRYLKARGITYAQLATRLRLSESSVKRLFARQTYEISLLTDREKLHARLDRPFNVEELTAGRSNETFLAAHP